MPNQARNIKTITLLGCDEIHIPDDSIPLIILLGHTESGNSELIVELSYFLKDQGYEVRLNKAFHSLDDACFYKWCDQLSIAYLGFDTPSIAENEYQLLEVINPNQEIVCRFMKLPAAYIYDPRAFNKSFYMSFDTPIRNLLNGCFQLSCARLWMFMPDIENMGTNNDDTSYFYVHWFIDCMYPDKMMCVCPANYIQKAKVIFQDRYTFDFPVVQFSRDVSDISALWQNIKKLLNCINHGN